MERVLLLERTDLALVGNIRTEKKEGGDWRMDGEEKVYGTYGEGRSGKGEIIWNVNKEYRKQKY